MSEPKKISFGFSKSAKKSNLVILPVVQEKKVELIDCLEGQSIKIKDAIEVENKPLVIPMFGDTNTLADRIRKTVAERKSNHVKNGEIVNNRPDSELTLDELAARQLILEARKFDIVKPNAVKVHTLPAVEDALVLEGSAEPTLDDYENVPIGDYGLAMLRGMGWSESSGIGKNKKVTLIAAPDLRPKGMGLGANKLVSSHAPKKVATDEHGKELTLKTGAHAKVIAGKEKMNYCVVQGLDDDGRVIVKMALSGKVLSLNEFLLVPVTSEEYAKSSKVLNNAKYEEFIKKTEKGVIKVEPKDKDVKIIISDDEKSDNDKPDNNKSAKRRQKNRSRDRKERSRSRSCDEVRHKRSKSKERRSRSRDTYRSGNKSIDKYSTIDNQYKRKYDKHSKDDSSDDYKKESEENSKKKHKKKSKKHKKHRSTSGSSDENHKHKSRKRKSSESDDFRYSKKSKKSKR